MHILVPKGYIMRQIILFLLGLYMLFVWFFVPNTLAKTNDLLTKKHIFYIKCKYSVIPAMLFVSTIIGTTYLQNFAINIGYIATATIFVIFNIKHISQRSIVAIILINIAYLCTIYVDILNIAEINILPLLIIIATISNIFSKSISETCVTISLSSIVCTISACGQSILQLGYATVFGYETMIVFVLAIAIAIIVNILKMSLQKIKIWRENRI